MSELNPDTFSPSHLRTKLTPLTYAERAAYDALVRCEATPDWLLREEAFELAARHLDEDSGDLKRLRRACRHLRAVRARARTLIDADDLWFAAQLIAHVLEVELGLDELEIVALFDAVGLPVEVVPHFRAIAAFRTPHGAALGALASDLAAMREEQREPDDHHVFDDGDFAFDDADLPDND